MAVVPFDSAPYEMICETGRGAMVSCDQCGTDNPTGAKFCSECGAGLVAKCAACTAKLSASAKFCNECGAATSTRSPSPASSAAAPESQAVRKPITALFGDLVGSTSFGEQVDPETARAVMADYYGFVSSTIEAHDGTVVKFMGDGVMAIFGIPEVAEDDAARAVAAGGALQRRFIAFATGIRERFGVELGFRVGINSGEIVIGDDDADMVGDVLNTAARLEAACEPGTVLVGEDTWRLTRSSIAYEQLDEIHVKGKAGPLDTFRVVGADDPTADAASSDAVIPFVGRGNELATLRSALDDARSSNACRLVTVIGAPGVGKTRLAAELRRQAPGRSFDLRLERQGSSTFAPVADLLRDALGHEQDSRGRDSSGTDSSGTDSSDTGSSDPDGSYTDRAEHDATIDTLIAGHAEAERLAAVLRSFVGDGEQHSTEESFWAVRRLLEHLAAATTIIATPNSTITSTDAAAATDATAAAAAAAATDAAAATAAVTDGPLVVVIDDIQWAEPLFWDLIDHLGEWTAASVLLVCLARPELRDLRPELTVPGRTVTASIALDGLDAENTLELAQRILSTDSLPGELLERIPDSTGGNPLFVRELVNMLVADGVLARSDAGWQLTIDADAIEVPPTIVSLLASRVERLPADEREVLELASVIGTEFDRGTLASIGQASGSGHVGSNEMVSALDRLRRKDLIEPSGAWKGDHPVLRFHHVLVRDASYRRILKARRSDLHERVGHHVAENGRIGDDTDISVGHHFEQAVQYRRELGRSDDATTELAVRAVERLWTAAERALDRQDFSAAGSAAIRALALVGDTPQRDELLLLGCESLISSGDVARVAPLVDELRARGTDARVTAWADCFSAQLWSLTDSDRLDEAERLSADAAKLLDAAGDAAGVAKARLVRSSTLARLGRVGECEAELDRALVAARSADDRRRTVAVLGAAPLAALWGPSKVARAGGRCLDVLRLLRITDASSPAVEATAVRCQGVLDALRGRFESARDRLDASRRSARELGLRQSLCETEMFAGFVELLADDPVAAERHLRLALDGFEALGIGTDIGRVRSLLAQALLRQGRVDEALPLAIDAVESAGQNLQTAMSSRTALAEIRAAQGSHAEAGTLVAEAIEIGERTDVILDHALAHGAAARVMGTAGRDDAARGHAGRAASLLDDKGASVGAARAETATSTASADSGLALSNAATEVAAAWVAALKVDRDRATALSHPEQEMSTQRRMTPHFTMVGEEVNDILASVWDNGEVTSTVLAVRGDNLCLSRRDVVSDGFEEVFLTVIQREGAVVRRTILFDEDQLQEALDDLDARWAEEVPETALMVQVMSAYRLVMRNGSPEGLRALLADDFVAVDRRQIAIERRDRDRFIESHGVLGAIEVTVHAIIRQTETVWLMSGSMVAGVDGSSWDNLFIGGVDADSKLNLYELFEFDAIDTAIARFDELTAAETLELTNSATEIDRLWAGHEATSQDITEPTAPPFTNQVFELQLQIDDIIASGRKGAVIDLLSLDFAAASDGNAHGILGSQVVDREMWASLLEDLPDFGTTGKVENRLIAIAGDDLCLVRTTVDIDGNLTERLCVLESDGESICRVDMLDQTKIIEAQVLMYSRWADQLGLLDDHFMRTMMSKSLTVDPEVLMTLVHPDFEHFEHRQLSYSVDGDYAQMEVSASTLALIDHVVHPAIHRLSDHAIFVHREEVAPDGDATSSLLVVGVQDGLFRTFDAYHLEDFDAAVARYEELQDGNQPDPDEA
ncbi:MAG: adenylate/guanylate cyclase domain-containing protein [Ilumatobacter sp.]